MNELVREDMNKSELRKRYRLSNRLIGLVLVLALASFILDLEAYRTGLSFTVFSSRQPFSILTEPIMGVAIMLLIDNELVIRNKTLKMRGIVMGVFVVYSVAMFLWEAVTLSGVPFFHLIFGGM